MSLVLCINRMSLCKYVPKFYHELRRSGPNVANLWTSGKNKNFIIKNNHVRNLQGNSVSIKKQKREQYMLIWLP